MTEEISGEKFGAMPADDIYEMVAVEALYVAKGIRLNEANEPEGTTSRIATLEREVSVLSKALNETIAIVKNIATTMKDHIEKERTKE